MSNEREATRSFHVRIKESLHKQLNDIRWESRKSMQKIVESAITDYVEKKKQGKLTR